jgi:quercetin dioxygenase-like cupin family protein
MPIAFLSQSELPAGEFSRELEGETLGIPASVIFVEAAPGEGPSLHSHAYAELFFVLEGEACFDDGTDERIVGAGDVAIVPPDQPHCDINASSPTASASSSISSTSARPRRIASAARSTRPPPQPSLKIR